MSLAFKKKHHPISSCASLLLVLFLSANCGGVDMDAPAMAGAGGGGGEFGATAGGVKDMSFARELIKNGQVPPEAAFTVEGMFSEHDLPLTGPDCTKQLCLRAGSGFAPAASGVKSAWIQVGMSSLIDPATYVRPTLAVVACVDVSGSMGWDYSDGEQEYPTAGGLSRRLLQKIAAQLGAADQVAIVTYGSSVSDLLPFTAGDHQTVIQGAINKLSTDGSTNMEAGLRRAYELTKSFDGKVDQVRVLLFSDVQPNVGATSGESFAQIVAEGAGRGVGLTLFSMGLGIGQEVLDHMVHLRGGNSFALFSSADVDKLMADSWPWMVSPIAYNLEINLAAGDSFKVKESFGFPASPDEKEIKLDVASVFLSKNKGAMLVRLEPAAELTAEAKIPLTLSYETTAGAKETETLEAVFTPQMLQAEKSEFAQPSVAKTVALALLTAGMKEAAKLYSASHEAAVEKINAVVARFADDLLSLPADEALRTELALAKKLQELMQSGAAQGDLYGKR